MRSRCENLATKADLTNEVSGLSARIENTGARLRAEMRELEQRIYVRMGGMIAGAAVFLTAVIGIATAILLANL